MLRPGLRMKKMVESLKQWLLNKNIKEINVERIVEDALKKYYKEVYPPFVEQYKTVTRIECICITYTSTSHVVSITLRHENGIITSIFITISQLLHVFDIYQ